jgi:hypothetical protein
LATFCYGRANIIRRFAEEFIDAGSNNIPEELEKCLTKKNQQSGCTGNKMQMGESEKP